MPRETKYHRIRLTLCLAVGACGSSDDRDGQNDDGQTGIMLADGSSGGQAAASEGGGNFGDDVDLSAGDTTPVATTGANPETNDDAGCGEVSVNLGRVPPTILLLLDQSLSMEEEDFEDMSRWDAVEQTLFGDEGVVRQLDGAVRFGMTLYTGEVFGPGTGRCPSLVEVEPMFDNADALAMAYAQAGPLGSTPTGESIDAVAPEFAALDVEGPKVIVLATDGEPNDCENPIPSGEYEAGKDLALMAAQRAYDLGISMFVISVGSEISVDHLQDMANVGAGKAVDDPMGAPFYQALNPAELVEAFQDIVQTVTTCEFAIDGIIDPARACTGTVSLDGTPLVCGEDWEVSEPSTLSLVGETCDAVKSGEHVLEATWPCGEIEPIK